MTNTQAVNGYELFHAKRVFDVLLGVQTPRNDHDDGISADGNFLNRDSREKVATVLSSLMELGLICEDERNKMLAINNACEDKASIEEQFAKSLRIAPPQSCAGCPCKEHLDEHCEWKGHDPIHSSACRFPKPVQSESEKRREWARDLQDARLKLKRTVMMFERYGQDTPRFIGLTLDKLKRVQNEIYNLNEEQGE